MDYCDLTCTCHFSDYYKSAIPKCCPGCHTPPKPRVTAKTLWKIVQSVTQWDDYQYNAFRFELALRNAPGAASAWGDKVVIMVSKQFATDKAVDLRQVLADELNSFLSKSGWPSHLEDYLNHPNLPMSWETIPVTYNPDYASVSNKPGVYVGPGGYDPAGDVGGSTVVRALEQSIPGINAYVDCPWCGKGEGRDAHDGPIVALVQHLNDHAHWSREQIADWLETLDVDLSFPPEPPPKKELPPARHDHLLIIFAPTQRAGENEIRRRRRDPRQCRVVIVRRGSDAVQRLYGMRDFQYFVVPGTPMTDEVLSYLTHIHGREVGEEKRPTYGPSITDMIADIYAPQVAGIQEEIQGFIKPVPSHIEIKFTKAVEAGETEVKQSPGLMELQVMQNVVSFLDVAKKPMDEYKDAIKKLLAPNPTPLQFPCSGDETCPVCNVLPPGALHLASQHHPQLVGQWLDEAFDKPDPLQAALEAKKSPNWAKFNQPKNPFKK